MHTSLHDASADGELAEVKRLLEEDPLRVHEKCDMGRTPLHYAATEGQLEAARLLLRAGADIDAEDNWNKTPLFLAVCEEPLVIDHTPMVTFLIQMGANANYADHAGDTPLHMACAFGDPGSDFALLQSGAKANVQNNRGNTPLHDSVISRDVKPVRMLLAHGADTAIRNNEGLTAQELALREGFLQMAEMLEE